MSEYNLTFLKLLERKLIGNGVCKVGFNESDQENNTPAQFLKKFKELVSTLVNNLSGCNIKWSIFVIAAFSVRYQQMIPSYLPEFIEDIEHLRELINHTPHLRVLCLNAQQKNYNCCSRYNILLLHWILVECNTPELRELQIEELGKLMESIKLKKKEDFLITAFKVMYSSANAEEETFKIRSSFSGRRYAFLDCKPDNLFKILHDEPSSYKGKKKNNNKINLNYKVSTILRQMPLMLYLGSPCQCQGVKIVALCEVIDISEYPENSFDAKSNRIVIEQSDLVRIRYILLFRKPMPPITMMEFFKQLILKSSYFLPNCVNVLLVTTLTYIYGKSVKSLFMQAIRRVGRLLLHGLL